MLPDFSDHLSHSTDVIFYKIFFVVIALWVANFSLKKYLTRPRALGLNNESYRVLALNASRVILAVLGTMIILDTVGISIAPLLASLGIGSIAIALALQDSLGNFISGIFLIVDQPLRPGDHIKGPDEIEGTVRKIGWRSTRIETAQGHVVLIPNSKLSSAIITNYDVPTPETIVPIKFVVDTQTDPDLLKNITTQTLTITQESRVECIKTYSPSYSITNISKFGIQVQVTLRVRSIADATLIKDHFYQALLRDFRESGIKLS